MANTLVILGNGFDMDLGLKTSFKDFINNYRFKDLPETNFIKQINGEKWCDLEGMFREQLFRYALQPSDTLLRDICDSWILIERAWGMFLPENTELSKIRINEQSCAYTMLKYCKNMSNWYSFNYTSPFYLARITEVNQINYVHSAFAPREYTPNGCMYLIYHNLIIGTESWDMPQTILNNDKLNHIIKQKNKYYKDCGLSQKLYDADNIILFGLSLNITDSDYFKYFFNDICNGVIKGKRIFFITKNDASFTDICENMNTWGIEYTKLLHSKNAIQCIYTYNGLKTPIFQKILELI